MINLMELGGRMGSIGCWMKLAHVHDRRQNGAQHKRCINNARRMETKEAGASLSTRKSGRDAHLDGISRKKKKERKTRLSTASDNNR